MRRENGVFAGAMRKVVPVSCKYSESRTQNSSLLEVMLRRILYYQNIAKAERRTQVYLKLCYIIQISEKPPSRLKCMECRG